jgi:hypothetical protein
MSDVRGTAASEELPHYRYSSDPPPSAWVAFAGTMLALAGAFHVIQGLVALFRDEYYLVSPSGLVVSVDYTTWGWVHLIGGAVVIAAGLGAVAGQTWARFVGVVVAGLSALLNVAFLAAYPIWSALMIALDILVIWALMVHGGDGPDRAETRST